MRALIYRFADGVETTSYEVAKNAGQPYECILRPIPEEPRAKFDPRRIAKILEKAKAKALGR